MPRASAAQLDEPAASPTLEASSAPRTETMTAAPASVRSSRQEVTLHQSPAVAQPTSSQSVSPHNPSCKEKKKRYPLPCKCPEVHFISLLRQYKVTADLQLYIWVLHFMSLHSINSDFYLELFATLPLLQDGGLTLVVRPTWTAYITLPPPAWFATIVLSGTTGRVQMWSLPWQPWWFAQLISDDVGMYLPPDCEVNVITVKQKYTISKKMCIFGKTLKEGFRWFQLVDILEGCFSNRLGTYIQTHRKWLWIPEWGNPRTGTIHKGTRAIF